MKRGIRYTLGGLAIAAALGVTYVLNFGLYPRFFDIAWDEEVQLHDGRVIVVHVKRFYQRKGLRLERFPKYPYRMGMEFTFDAGSSTGRFTHYFKRGNLNFLDEKNGKWYIGYYADAGDDSSELGSRKIYPHVAVLNRDKSITKPETWAEVPGDITQVNIMPSTPDEQVISKFDGVKLTLQTKMQHWAAYPTGADDHIIQRITPQAFTQGEKK